MSVIKSAVGRNLTAVTFSPNTHGEEDRGGHKGKAESFDDLLPVLLNVLLPEHRQVDVDIDEERTEKATYDANDDGSWDIE